MLPTPDSVTVPHIEGENGGDPGCFQGQVGLALMNVGSRASYFALAIIFLWIGAMKFTDYEAFGIAGFVEQPDHRLVARVARRSRYRPHARGLQNHRGPPSGRARNLPDLVSGRIADERPYLLDYSHLPRDNPQRRRTPRGRFPRDIGNARSVPAQGYRFACDLHLSPRRIVGGARRNSNGLGVGCEIDTLLKIGSVSGSLLKSRASAIERNALR
jgi:hypothetical protein